MTQIKVVLEFASGSWHVLNIVWYFCQHFGTHTRKKGTHTRKKVLTKR